MPSQKDRTHICPFLYVLYKRLATSAPVKTEISPGMHIALACGKQSHAQPASAGRPAEERERKREVSLTVPRCHRCSSAAAASRSCSTVRVSARALEQLKEGPPRSRVARQEATLANNRRRWIARCMAMWRGFVRRPRCVGYLAARLPPAAALIPVGT